MFVDQSLCGHVLAFFLGKFLGAGWSDHMVSIRFVFRETDTWFSKVVVSHGMFLKIPGFSEKPGESGCRAMERKPTGQVWVNEGECFLLEPWGVALDTLLRYTLTRGVKGKPRSGTDPLPWSSCSLGPLGVWVHRDSEHMKTTAEIEVLFFGKHT